MRLSVLHYHLGEAEESLNEVRECLRLDPDHKDCFTLYKKLKKVAKFVVAAREARNSEEWEDCKEAAQKVRFLLSYFYLNAQFRSCPHITINHAYMHHILVRFS